MPETTVNLISGIIRLPLLGLTSFSALSVYLRIGISSSASKTDDRVYLSPLLVELRFLACG